MDVAGLCPACCASLFADPEDADGETGSTETSGGSETSSSEGGGSASGEGARKEVPGPGSYLDDIPGFDIREVEKWGFSAWGLGRGVGMGVERRPRKLRKARKVVSVKRAKVRMVLEEGEGG